MNIFELQDEARRNTMQLVVLFTEFRDEDRFSHRTSGPRRR